MTSIFTVPDLTFDDVDWEPRRVLGSYPLGGDPPARSTIGHSDVEHLTPQATGIDERLRRHLIQEAATHAYFLLHLSCTFRPGGAPLTGAVLAVRLAPQGDGVASVWSMQPSAVATRVKHSHTVSLSPTVKLLPTIIEAELKTERSIEYESENWYLKAAGDGEPTAEWYFRRTADVDLIGSHALTLVGRVPAATTTVIQIGLQAEIEKLRKFRGNLPARQREVLFSS
ncbi:hypothetical protein [Streptacidiphilus sp. PAMC 29251]